MKVVIFAGGLGSRIAEETEDKPKPMIQLNGDPIIWHLMNSFSLQGLNDFVILTGYKSEVIDSWLQNNKILNSNLKEMSVQTINTGLYAQTGERLLAAMKHLPNQSIIVTYGDGLANVSIAKLLNFHTSHRKLATVTAVRPPARFGYMKIQNDKVTKFGEKNQSDEGWINGGFFVLNKEVVNYIKLTDGPFETGALMRLTDDSQLMAYKHTGFWQPMDTLREKRELEKYAMMSTPPWLNIN